MYGDLIVVTNEQKKTLIQALEIAIIDSQEFEKDAETGGRKMVDTPETARYREVLREVQTE